MKALAVVESADRPEVVADGEGLARQGMDVGPRTTGAAPRERRGEVAIIGMGCMFAGAPSLETFWQNILGKVDAVTDPPPEAWDAAGLYDPGSTANDRVYCKRGGYLGPLARFNPLDYGIMPAGLEGGEPDHWLALKVAYQALADAAYLERLKHNPQERRRTAVILGKGNYLNRGNLNMVQHSLVVDQTLRALHILHPEYRAEDLELLREALKSKLPPFDSDAAAGLVPNIVAGRIANRLDLMGPSYTVDAACASSLVALEMAVRDLLAGQCDLALAGGVQVSTPFPIWSLFCQLNALSRRQEIRPFDKDADGTILGEGVGIVVLKRRAEAERDGDRIYALIRAMATASDGRATSVLAPRVEGEALALQRAYELAGVSPETVGLIEAHGTGTSAGDVAEIQALSQVFGERRGSLPHCALGTVKSMIGHSLAAAGIAGVIKTALALYHKVLPPTLHCDHPLPKLRIEDTVFYINTEARPWIHGARPGTAPRRAGVNAFGFGGINAHLIMEEHPDQDEGRVPTHLRRWDSEVVVLEGDSRDQLIQRARQLHAYVGNSADVALLDLAFTLNTALSAKPWRLSLVAESTSDLQQKLSRALQRLTDPSCRQIKDVRGIYFFDAPLDPAGKLTFLFPGEGSQYPNMLADVCLHFPDVRAYFDRIDGIFIGHPRHYLPSDFIFPRPALAGHSAQEPQLWQIDGAIEAVLTANQALLTVFERLGLRPQLVVGHSTGDYSAMRAAGVIALSDEAFLQECVLELNRAYTAQRSPPEDAPSAALLAVGASLEHVSTLLPQIAGQIYVGMDNCPHQTVLVGESSAIAAAKNLMGSQGLICETLPFARPYHTPLFVAQGQSLRAVLEHLPLAPPATGLYSCTTAALYPDDVDAIRALMRDHWVRPVRFRETIQAMYAAGARLFVEVGPRGNLTSFVDDILRAQPHLAIPANLQSRSGISQLNHVLGLLAAQRVPMQLDYLYHRRRPRRLSLDLADRPRAGLTTRDTSLKLATGWAGMEISPEVSARLRERVSQRAQADEARRAPVDDGQRQPAPLGPAPASATGDVTPARPGADGRDGQAPADGDAAHRRILPTPMSQPARGDTRARVMRAHLQLMGQFLDAQQAAMEQFLIGDAAAQPEHPDVRPSAVDAVARAEKTAHAQAAVPLAAQPPPPAAASLQIPPAPPRGAAGDASAGSALALEEIKHLLVRLISDKTGYPSHMLTSGVDLEADLGIDSIKRVEVLSAFNRQTGLLREQDMDRMLATRCLQEMLDYLATASPPTPGAPHELPPRAAGVAVGREGSGWRREARMPFIRVVNALTPGQELQALCRLDLSQDLFLKDHTLGRSISDADRALFALPVVPLTISMEIMAEAAALLLPDQVLIGMRHVRSSRWILLEEDTVTLQVMARRRPAPGALEVEVALMEANEGVAARRQSPIIEGTLVFSDQHRQPPDSKLAFLRSQPLSRWVPHQLYTHGMFHGPAFQAVASLDHSGGQGAVATLQSTTTHQFLRSGPEAAFVAEPVALDAAGQVVGLWALEQLNTGFVVFPFQLEALHLYGPPLGPLEGVECLAQINLLEGMRLRSNIDLIRPDGRLRAQLVGWDDVRFDVPGRFYQFILSPRQATVSEPWATPLHGLPDPEALECCRVMGFAEDFFGAHGGFWEKVLAHLVLSRDEREVWRGLKLPARRRAEWLLGRVATKDAVRRLVQRAHGMTLPPADVEIVADERGQPTVRGAWLARLDQPVTVSVAHTAGVAAAVAGLSRQELRLEGLGIDIEHIDRRPEAFADVAFSASEKTMLAALDRPASEAWPLRVWCAKEAVGKALGRGLAGGPLGILAEDVGVASGNVRVRLAGELARQLPHLDGRPLIAYTAREGDLVVARALNLGD